MKLFAMILLLLTTFSATASDYIYLRTGDVDVGFDVWMGFGLSIKKTDRVCDGEKCYEIAKQFDDVDEYHGKNKRCFVRYSSSKMLGSSLFKPDYYMGSEKVTGDPKYITFACKRVDVGSDKAKAAEAQYNGCLRANGVDPRVAARSIELLNWVEQLRKLQLSEEAASERLLEKYEFSEYSAAMDWMMAHQTCFPKAYPNAQ